NSKYNGYLDTSPSDRDVGCDAAAKNHRMAQFDSISADARTLHIFLRAVAPRHIRVVRPILCNRRDDQRFDEASVHHGGIFELRHFDAACHHINEKLDPAARWPSMAAVTPADLSEHSGRSGPLFLGSEVEYYETCRVHGFVWIAYGGEIC